mgnify:CR=1 FL=1
MIDDYRKEAAERLKEDLPPLSLTAKQTAELVTLLKSPDTKDTQTLMELFCHRVPSGVDQAAYIKAAFLTDIAKGIEKSSLISPKYAIELLGTMVGGYNVQSLISLLDSDLADDAVKVLSHIILIFDAFHDVSEKVKSGNKAAMKLMESWANGDWFLKKSALPKEIKAIVLETYGSGNTTTESLGILKVTFSEVPITCSVPILNSLCTNSESLPSTIS